MKNETGQLEVNLVQPTLIMEHPKKSHCIAPKGKGMLIEPGNLFPLHELEEGEMMDL